MTLLLYLSHLISDACFVTALSSTPSSRNTTPSPAASTSSSHSIAQITILPPPTKTYNLPPKRPPPRPIPHHIPQPARPQQILHTNNSTKNTPLLLLQHPTRNRRSTHGEPQRNRRIHKYIFLRRRAECRCADVAQTETECEEACYCEVAL